jgi:hypothetical protein
MMMNTTIEQLRNLRLPGMAEALKEQLTQAGMTAMSFEERLTMLVDKEVHLRDDKRKSRLLKQAQLKYPQASIEVIDTRPGRLGAKRALGLDYRPYRGGQIVAGLCTSAICLSAGVFGQLPARATYGRRASDSPWQCHVWQVADSVGQD